MSTCISSLGYAILLVNYRGSSGVGQDSLNHLVGKIGKSDVADCVLATVQAYIQYPWIDSNRAALVGSSHGGFLVTHLSCHYPDMYKAVVARNPIIDVAFMTITSDIPDWYDSDVLQLNSLSNIFLFLSGATLKQILYFHKKKNRILMTM